MDFRIFPKKRQIPANPPKSFVLFPFEMHEKMRGTFEEKEEESLRLITSHLEHFKKPYIASSHGKDSIVMVHLVYRAAKALGVKMPEIWLNNTLNIYKEERAYWEKFNAWLGIEDRFREFKPQKDENGKTWTVWSIADKFGLPKFRQTAKKDKNYKDTNIPKCCEYLKKESIKKYLKELPIDERYDLNFYGSRGEESQARSLILLQRCRSFFKKTRGAYPIQTVTPLSYWKYADILEYFARYEIPKNPVYAIHNIKRMGCASCPAYIGWEKDMLQDPTNERFMMLKQNLKIMSKTDKKRLRESLKTITQYVKENKMDEAYRLKILELCKSFDHRNFISDWFAKV